MFSSGVKLDQELVNQAASRARNLKISPAEQIEKWAKIGMLIEANPEFAYEMIREALLVEAEKEIQKTSIVSNIQSKLAMVVGL